MAILAFALTGACAVIDNPSAPAPSTGLNEGVFRCSVESVLVRQCSYTACHGVAGSALRVYSPGKLRASPPADIEAAIAPLTEAEHHANFVSASGFAFSAADPVDNLLLRKTIPETQRGYAHEGGAIFTTTGDPQWMVIAAWLSGSGRCP